MLMEAVVYSTFRNHLKDYMKKVNDEFEPLAVVNKNPDEDSGIAFKKHCVLFKIKNYQTRF